MLWRILCSLIFTVHGDGQDLAESICRVGGGISQAELTQFTLLLIPSHSGGLSHLATTGWDERGE